jgi:hypothetical protein
MPERPAAELIEELSLRDELEACGRLGRYEHLLEDEAEADA